MKTNNFFEDFFTSYAKVIFFIPVAIIVIGLFIKFNQSNNLSNNINPSPTTSFPTFSPTPSPLPVKFNLEGPFVCQLKIKDGSVTAFVEKKKIYAKVERKEKVENYLILDDCLYHWEEKKYSGEKKCGIGQYLSLFENLSFFNMGLLNTLFGKQLEANNLSLDDIFSSCKKNKIENKEVFNLPSFVIFKNL